MSGHLMKVQHSLEHRYLLIGGACLDTFVKSASVLLWGKTRVRTTLRTVGGGGTNVAIGLKVLAPHAEVVLLAGTGEDAAGEVVRGQIAAHGVALPWGVVPGRPTSMSFIVTEQQAGRSTIFTEA